MIPKESTQRRPKKTRSKGSSRRPTRPQSQEPTTRSRTDAWHQYALDVVAGSVPANKLVRLSCQRYLHDLDEADNRGLYFDWTAARRVVLFFATFLRHSKGEWAGRPFLLEPWQQFIVANLFGWKRKIDGTRRFRMAYIAIPRKNGKSTMVAGI